MRGEKGGGVNTGNQGVPRSESLSAIRVRSGLCRGAPEWRGRRGTGCVIKKVLPFVPVYTDVYMRQS